MGLENWLDARHGIAHRTDALNAGFSDYAITKEIHNDRVHVVRREWLTTRTCTPELSTAARLGGRLTCVSAAKELGLWTIDDHKVHFVVPPNSRVRPAAGVRLHWSRPFVPTGPFVVLDPVENALALIADCQPFERAIVVFDSAIRSGRVAYSQLTRWQLRSKAFRRLAKATSKFSDSGIETLPVVRLRRLGIQMRQQVVIDGHPVDGLIGDRLILQFDGFGPHSDPARRRRDLAQDARLVALGYTVYRFDYYMVLYDWGHIESTVLASMAQGLHLLPQPAFR